MSSRFEELFGAFDSSELKEAFSESEIQNVAISMEKKHLSLFIGYERF